MSEVAVMSTSTMGRPYSPPDRTNRGNFLHKEPGVITINLISKCLLLNLNKSELGEFSLEGKVTDDRCAQQLRIEYESISQIANISHMTNLTKLQLSNNVIGKIEGLDTLVNLVWLDLSFNNIKIIENLEKLSKLQMLNLHRNLIEDLANLDSLLRLEMFLISSNGLKSVEQMKYLHRFICLRSVAFKGNPVTFRPDFRQVLFAFVPQIAMLDYKPVSRDEKAKAAVLYKSQVDRLTLEDNKLQRRYSVMTAEADIVSRRFDAFVDPFYENKFFEEMYEADIEGRVILFLDDIDDIVVMYRELFRRGANEIFEKGLRCHTLRQNESQAWKIATDEEKLQVQQAATIKTEDFVTYSQVALKDVRQGISILDDYYRRFKRHRKPKACKSLRAAVTGFAKDYIRKLHNVWFEIMSDEMNLHEKMLEIGQELNRSITDIITAQLEQLRGLFGTLRDLQGQLNERLVETLVTYGELSFGQDDIPDDLKHLVEDKETLANTIQLSYEHHLQFIDSREDQMMTRLKHWLEELKTDIPKNEIGRSRLRISEIGSFTDAYYHKLMRLRLRKYATGFIPKPRENQDWDPKMGPGPKSGKDESLFDYARRRHEEKVAKKERKKNGKRDLSADS